MGLPTAPRIGRVVSHAVKYEDPQFQLHPFKVIEVDSDTFIDTEGAKQPLPRTLRSVHGEGERDDLHPVGSRVLVTYEGWGGFRCWFARGLE